MDETIKMPGNNKIKAFYAGSLSIPYLDWATLRKVVTKYPEIDLFDNY